MKEFIPASPSEVAKRYGSPPDFICVTGDAYVDHPSFGIAIVARELEHLGFKVAVLPQPDYKTPGSMAVYGRPRIAFMITGGNIDSMVANYTVAKKPRRHDPYCPGGINNRPDHACTVYCRAARRDFPDCPIVIGGIEASLRRFAHYDYWSDRVMPSILADSSADLLIFGMGERQIEQIATRLSRGEPVSSIKDVRGTAYITNDPGDIPRGAVSIPSFERVAADKTEFARAFIMQYDEQDAVSGRPVVQKHGDGYLVQNPPMPALTREELDAVFTLPFTRSAHPIYGPEGIRSLDEVRFSIMHNRGCFGHCAFCSIAAHQGRQVVSRSIESVVREAEGFLKDPEFKGIISDVGGPTADFRYPSCDAQQKNGLCKRKRCLGTTPCKNLKTGHGEYIELLRRLRAIKGVRKVFVRSGLRYDYMLLDKDDEFFDELVKYHISGQLKVAPEHISDRVLSLMGKPSVRVFERFAQRFYAATRRAGKKQYLVPYLMSSHPGSELSDAIELALFLKRNNMRPEQVQDFYPTPGSLSTAMFYTGLDPYTMKPVYVARTEREKRLQRALLQYYLPQNHRDVIEALKEAGRTDLIAHGEGGLVPPDIKTVREQRQRGKQQQRNETGRGGAKQGSRRPKEDKRAGKKR